MARCWFCHQEMTRNVSCVDTWLDLEGRRWRPVRWGDEADHRGWVAPGRPECSDCGAPPGGVHHPGCCIERCACCGGQAWTCECRRGIQCGRLGVRKERSFRAQHHPGHLQ